MYTSVMEFCYCGNTVEVWQYIIDQLNKLERKEYPKYDDLPSMFFLYWAHSCGLTGHGVSVRCSWLTKKGLEYIAELEMLIRQEAVEQLEKKEEEKVKKEEGSP